MNLTRTKSGDDTLLKASLIVLLLTETHDFSPKWQVALALSVVFYQFPVGQLLEEATWQQ